MENIGGRSFVFGVVIIIMIFALTVMKIDYQEFFQTVMIIYATFVSGSTIAKFSPGAKVEAIAKVDSDIVLEKKKK